MQSPLRLQPVRPCAPRQRGLFRVENYAPAVSALKGDSMREKLARFMAGRNGVDQLARAVSVAVLVLFLLSLFTRDRLSSVLFLLAVAGIVYMYFRVFSRNTAKRAAENSRYLHRTASVRAYFRSLGERWKQRRDYRFFRCPACSTLLRVPRGKGKIKIVCRKCGNSFIKNT